MKRFHTRGVAAALAFLLATTPAASASVALGDELHGGSLSLAEGTTLTKQIFWSNTYSDLRTEHYFTYTPSPAVSPVVAYGDKVLSKSSVSAMAKGLEAQGKRVLGGINGDFYVVSTGAPVGLLVTDGSLRSSSDLYNSVYAVGFYADGTAFIDKPQLAVTATFHGATHAIASVNKVRTAKDGYFLFSEDFSTATQNTSPGVDVILTPLTDNLGQSVQVDLDVSKSSSGSQLSNTGSEQDVTDSQELDPSNLPTEGGDRTPLEEISTTLTQSDRLIIGSRVTCRVEQVLQSTGSIAIPKGSFVLTINNQSDAALVAQLSALQVGDTVDIDITSTDQRWTHVQQAVGGLYKLVTDGVVESGLAKGAAARSAVGVKADGTAVFYTIDGAQKGYSIGASLTQVAQRLVELGCVEAICLDGGGSTTASTTYPNSSSQEIINQPSDGYPRSVSNAIFLVSNETATGVLDHFYVSPYSSLLLSGASVPLSVTGIDTGWHPISTAYSGLSWSIRNGDGTVTGDGIFTAGSESGVSQVTASGGAAEGSASVTVVQTPDTILLSNEATGASVTSLSLEPNQVIDLKATSLWKKLTLTSQDTCYTWSVDASAGTVDANGVLTAAPQSGTGNLTVSAGGRSLTIPVTVTGHILGLEDFERSDLTTFVGTTSSAVSLQSGGDQVKFGQQSLKLSYDTSANGSSTVASFLTIPSGERYLTLWVYGDQSGNTLTATVTTADGGSSEVVLTGIDFTGWKRLTVPLPQNASALSALNVIFGGGSLRSGVLWLDQLTTANEAVLDTTAPTVSLSVSGGQAAAYVSDNFTRSFTADQISITLDGAPLSFQWNAGSGQATATLPADDGALHRLTVTATDVSGNIGRASYDIIPAIAPENPFVDMDDHWASQYTTYLYRTGVTTGVDTPAGLAFQPNQNITRGEFSLMVARWLGLDLTSYAGVALPFADTDAIPSWAVNGIKAMYQLGVLKGSEVGGKLHANAGSTISRAEAMTILGRIQTKGYPQPQLTFADADQVPSWSLPYVQSLVAQGVVSGFENRVNPNSSITRCEVAKILFAIR